MRVLVVDDDPVSLRLITHCLRTLGYQVDVALDGLAAQRMFLQHRFPIVITDWEMPGLSGPELCQQIRDTKCPGYTYIILWSQRAERRDLIQGLSAGADDFASKPFDPDEIRVRLRAAERILSLESQLLEANRKLTLMNSRLQKMSRLDPLMEIGNRMAFEEELAAFHLHAASHGRTYGVVMCDVDRFKQVNDRFGHQHGDEILRQVAGEIRKAIRSQDLAFRYGGGKRFSFCLAGWACRIRRPSPRESAAKSSNCNSAPGKAISVASRLAAGSPPILKTSTPRTAGGGLWNARTRRCIRLRPPVETGSYLSR